MVTPCFIVTNVVTLFFLGSKKVTSSFWRKTRADKLPCFFEKKHGNAQLFNGRRAFFLETKKVTLFSGGKKTC